MNPIRFWLAVFVVLAFVAVGPAWNYFAGPAMSGLPTSTQWLVAALLPFTLLLGLASWMQGWSA